MNRFTMACGAIVLLAICMVLVPLDSYGQKKKAPAKTEQTSEQPAPTPVQTKMGNTLKDVLNKFKGEKTNMGMLSKVEGDYFVVEEDGVSTIHPMSAIVGIKLLKSEEGEEDAAKIEIVLMR